MSEYLKSAFDYFGSSARSKGGNELIGNTVEIGNQLYKVVNLIAEGGFAVVFEIQDTKKHNNYALKRLLSHDTDTSLAVNEEISYLKKLSGHPNIIQLITATSFPQQKPNQNGMEFLIITELCTGGQVIQLMQRRNKPFPFNVTLQMFYQVCQAIEHMHRQPPPIIHRDLKVENLLISGNGVIKLCDFGSATTKVHSPDTSWSGTKRSEVQEEIEKHTTPMYRAPEMIDLYQNFPISTACDIWALGCVFYYFCFNKHPFEDSAKLAILNANYTIPTTEIDCRLIYQMLVIDPRQRLGISEIISEVKSKASALNITLAPSVAFDRDSLIHLPSMNQTKNQDNASPNMRPNKPPPPKRPDPLVPRDLIDLPPTPENKDLPQARHQQAKGQDSYVHNTSSMKPPVSNPVQTSNDGNKMFGLLNRGAGNIMKNIRDVSNKVIEQVSSSMNKTDLDLVYVTSRIIMMPIPAEAGIELLTKDKIDDVQTFLEFRHPNQYYIYNLGLKFVPNDKFKDRLMHLGFDPTKPPSLNSLVSLCVHQLQWLLSDTKNVIVVQCTDGRAASGICVMALLCFCGLVNNSSDAARIVKFRRNDCSFTPSQMRYADYVCRLMKNIVSPGIEPEIPHNLAVVITDVELCPVPIFNKSKNGLRPFVEIFRDYKMVYSSVTNYEDMPVFTYEQKSVHIPIPKVCVQGDLNIAVYHTRSNIVAKGKIYSIKVCETQLYSGYLAADSSEVCFTKQQLDHCDSEEEKYPNGFSLKIRLQVQNKEAISYNQIQTLSWNSEKFKKEIVNRRSVMDRLIPFNTKEEMEACLSSAGVKLPVNESKPQKPEIAKKPKLQSMPTEDFFFTLDNKEKTANSSRSSSVVSECYDDHSTFQSDTNKGVNPTNEKNEAVGDLLGDFDKKQSVQNNNSAAPYVNFFGSPGIDQQQGKASSDVDLLGSFDKTEPKVDSNLLSFESSQNDKGQSSMFDLFGQNIVSSSTVDLTSHQSHFDDWGTYDLVDERHFQPSPMKPSNSTSNLTTMKNGTQMKGSPSFHGNEPAQTTDAYENFPQSVPSKPAVKPKPSPGAKPKLPEPPDNSQTRNRKDAFQDLLGDFKATDSGHNGTKSIKDIRKEAMAKTTDPDTLKVLDWTEGKEKNIRALLCSLHSILWADIRWSGVNMSELVSVGQVKKAYKNAIRCVHPDKWNNSEHENLAKMIMMELNEAMAEFETEKNACQ